MDAAYYQPLRGSQDITSVTNLTEDAVIDMLRSYYRDPGLKIVTMGQLMDWICREQMMPLTPVFVV